MGIVPDGEDRTWVLERASPECGFDTREIEGTAVAGLLRTVAGRWVGVLGGEGVRRRPAADGWSPLECGATGRVGAA